MKSNTALKNSRQKNKVRTYLPSVKSIFFSDYICFCPLHKSIKRTKSCI